MKCLFLVVTPYDTAKEDYGKRYLTKIPERRWVQPGDMVVCAKCNGKETIFTAMTPEFEADDGIMPRWGTNADMIRTVVAILHREDLDTGDESVMQDEPVIDG